MLTLPVFSTIAKAFAFFAQYLGSILKLFCIAIGLGLAAAAVAGGGYYLTDSWVVGVPAVVFLLFAWAPLMLRLYQLVVFGRMDQVGYLATIFSAQSAGYVGYSLLTMLIMGLGLGLSAIPVVLAGSLGADGGATAKLVLAGLVSVGLAITFMILLLPVDLVLPAVAVERRPSLGKAYNLGAANKMRLFCALVVPGVGFAVLGQLVEVLGNMFGADRNLTNMVLLMPLHLVFTVVNTVVNTAVLGLSYRFLRGLPDPQDPQGFAGRPIGERDEFLECIDPWQYQPQGAPADEQSPPAGDSPAAGPETTGTAASAAVSTAAMVAAAAVAISEVHAAAAQTSAAPAPTPPPAEASGADSHAPGAGGDPGGGSGGSEGSGPPSGVESAPSPDTGGGANSDAGGSSDSSDSSSSD